VVEAPVIVITGANGFIGGHLVRHFDEAGWTVRALVHRLPGLQRPGVEYRMWQLGDPLGTALDGVDALIHAASVPYDRPDASRTNVEASAQLLAESREAGVGRVIFLSSMSARPGAVSQYGRDKLLIARQFDRPTELVVRPGLVLGDGGLFDRLRRFVERRRVVPLVGGGRQLFQTVFVDDLTSAITVALEDGLHGSITVAEREPVEFRELLAEIARQSGSRVRFVPVPYRPVAWTMRVAGAVGLRLPVSSDNLLGLRALVTEDVNADLERLGIEIRDYRATLRAIFAGG
jgi:nucleoside-diphosphate-sugar epimerase